ANACPTPRRGPGRSEPLSPGPCERARARGTGSRHRRDLATTRRSRAIHRGESCESCRYGAAHDYLRQARRPRVAAAATLVGELGLLHDARRPAILSTATRVLLRPF